VALPGSSLACRRRVLPIAWAVALGLVGSPVLAGPGPEPDWLELLAPAEGETESAVPLLEVRGRAGARGLRGHDIVLLIDVSGSTTRPSGLDLDGDGDGGRTSADRLRALESDGASKLLRKRLATLDLEDSVLFAELLAAEHLLARLRPQAVRVGIVTFSDRARVRAPLGTPPRGLERALREVRRDFHADLRGTHFADAIDTAVALLRPPAAPVEETSEAVPLVSTEARREASILLLSDGAPTLPVHRDRARLAALAAADRAFAAEVRIYSFALGNEADDALDVYAGMAARTGGRMERLERPGDAIARLRLVDLADLQELEVHNLTTGQPARAVRRFPDGSFDGFVLLAEGLNRLRVTAVASDGRRASAERRVRYTKGASDGEAEALLEELRRRTRETELWAELEHGRADTVLEVDLRVSGRDD